MTIIKFESEDHNTESLNLGEGEVVMRAPHVVAFSRTATQNIMAFLEAMKAGESPPPLNKWESELFERTLPRIYELVKLREAFLKQSPSLWVLEEFIQRVLEIMRQLKLPDELTPYQHDAYESASPPVGLPQYNQVDVNKYRQKTGADSMQMSDYQILASETGIYPPGCSLFYPIIGLAGEVGEVCEKIKKVYRDDGGILKEEKRQALRAPVNGSCRDLGPGEHPFDRAERNLAGQLRLDG